MARFRHEIELAPLPRPWFEHAVRRLFEVVEELRFDRDGRLTAGTGTVDAFRLTDGEHLTEGARYEITFELERATVRAEVEMLAWKPSGVTRLRVNLRVKRFAVTSTIEVHRDRDRLRAVRVTGGGKGDKGWARLVRLSWDARADLHRWWEQAASRRRERSAPPISATLEAGPARARFHVACRKKSSTAWSVRPVLALTGRGLFRPLGLLLLFARSDLASDFREAMDEFASSWQRAIPWLASSPATGPLKLRDERTITALPRPWLDGFARAMHSRVKELPFKEGRLVTGANDPDDTDADRLSTAVELVEGRHLESGAYYHLTRRPPHGTRTEIHLASLDMTGESRIEASAVTKDDQSSWSATFRSIAHPETLTASGTYAPSGDWNELLHASWRLDAGLTDAPRLRYDLEHPLFLVTLNLTARPSAKGTWKVTQELTVEGREAGRSLIQLVHLVDHAKLTATYAEEAEQWASDWNDRFADSTTQDPAEVAATVLHDLLNPRKEEIGRE